MIRVFLLDESITIRRALQMYLSLEPDLQVVGVATNRQDASALLPAAKPDVIIVSMDWLEKSALATLSALRASLPACPIVLLLLYDDLRLRRQAEEAGASAFVSKHDSIEVLLNAIRQVISTPGISEAPLA
jgi:DNA-binding NarL/FixJ family response regulator